MRDTLCALTHKAATAIALSTLLLTACTTLESPDDTSASVSTPRAYSETLNLDGRLSVQYQKDDKDEAIHVSFTWQQSKERNTITILSPLGQILATIDVTPNSATLTQSGQAPRSAADADALAQQALGWPLPVSGLRNWLQGYAIDGNKRAFIASPSNTKVTTSDGWHIQYQSWQDDHQAAMPNRPKRIDLERQTEQAGKVAIRIVLDNWQTQ
ncbi:lipoprotein insertase outer membrane protein LolB [Herminiimonas fonticola]|uniref:lipoprotein insertase outer membrane protein LolB n=1 Tax=Herminiimonas fonticola TaxID=303380 RepID=UPI003340E118